MPRDIDQEISDHLDEETERLNRLAEQAKEQGFVVKTPEPLTDKEAK